MTIPAKLKKRGLTKGGWKVWREPMCSSTGAPRHNPGIPYGWWLVGKGVFNIEPIRDAIHFCNELAALEGL